MCLTVSIKDNVVFERGVSKAPKRRIAYKLVTPKRRAYFRASYLPLYTYRSIHSETNGNIIRGRRTTSYGDVLYNAGIHVYTTLRYAHRRRRLGLGNCIIVRVEVNAADWIASGTRNDAVYSKIKVLARVK